MIFEYYRNKKMKEKQHKIYSVSKSILSVLIGIAIDKGFIENVNTPIIHYFPEFNKDKENERITIKHLLTMTSGLHWPGNNGMIPSKNWVKGQYIIVAPDYQLVTVFTSSFKDGATRPLQYFKEYLLEG
ncbi:serine hydrolase [Bacillus chungangensis]|uniref:CubicO group peptidase (Beta-lactamase class C family) n=1 Tax=Bacillus chungangensis TaxID=587633 RepID=A0ABT9WQ96_9BACI|nr:serine hydrolase [Bacillus chungangensis]MDQ0175463.1 CubicO group peptidase (beta-lactamase class C family) [Bacillus chungangensis]